MGVSASNSVIKALIRAEFETLICNNRRQHKNLKRQEKNIWVIANPLDSQEMPQTINTDWKWQSSIIQGHGYICITKPEWQLGGLYIKELKNLKDEW